MKSAFLETHVRALLQNYFHYFQSNYLGPNNIIFNSGYSKCGVSVGGP